MLTKKNYVLIADVLRINRPGEGLSGLELADALRRWRKVVRDLASEFQRDNPNFKKETFYRACGYVSGQA